MIRSTLANCSKLGSIASKLKRALWSYEKESDNPFVMNVFPVVLLFLCFFFLPLSVLSIQPTLHPKILLFHHLTTFLHLLFLNLIQVFCKLNYLFGNYFQLLFLFKSFKSTIKTIFFNFQMYSYINS